MNTEKTRQMKISDLLGHGKEAAIVRRDLETMSGLDGRTIRLMIERERRDGTPILSGQTGYYLGGDGDEAEAEHFVRSMRRRARQILRTASAVEKAMGID